MTYQAPPAMLTLGGWTTPFGIGLVIDHLAALLIATASSITLAVLGYSRLRQPVQLPLVYFMLAGVILSFITGDFFNLFVAFEIMLMASYSLMAASVPASALKHMYTYLILNIIGSALFLSATGLVYRLFGTLNFSDLSQFIGTDSRSSVIAILVILVYGLKAGVIFYWLPASYTALPPAIAALFAGLLTKVGVYALIRVLGVLIGTATLPLTVLYYASIIIMILGMLLAIGQRHIQMILSYNLISHVGFMILGIALYNPLGLTGTLYYMLHHMLSITALFLIAGIMQAETQTPDTYKMGHLMAKRPGLTLLFGIQALGLIGMPPFSGFWGKWLLLTASIATGNIFAVTGLIIATVLTLYSMIMIFFNAFYAEPDNIASPNQAPKTQWPAYASVIGLTVLTVGLGIGSFIGVPSSAYAVDQIRDFSVYIK